VRLKNTIHTKYCILIWRSWCAPGRGKDDFEGNSRSSIPNQTLTSEESLWPRGGWNVLERDSDSMNIELILFGSCDNGLGFHGQSTPALGRVPGKFR
jgi:hypothetical protein